MLINVFMLGILLEIDYFIIGYFYFVWSEYVVLGVIC